MRELERRHKLKSRLYSLPVLIILLVITILCGKWAYSGVSKWQESEALKTNLESKAAILTQRQVELERNIAKLQTPEGLYEEIKRKFSVSEEGEHMAVIIDARYVASTTESKDEGWLDQWWDTMRDLWQD